MSCTSKWRILSVRRAASRTTRKSFGREVGERRAFGEPLAEFDGLGRQSLVAQCLQRGLE